MECLYLYLNINDINHDKQIGYSRSHTCATRTVEEISKFDVLLSLPPLVADYAPIISGIRRCGKSTLLAQLSVDRYKPEEVLSEF